MQFAMVCVWYIRLRTLIGPVYPRWVQYPTLLLTSGLPVLFLIDAITISGRIKELKIGFVCDYSSPLRDFYMLISGILLVVPAIVFLILFLAPICQYCYDQTSSFMSLIFHHVVITMLDIIIHATFMIVYETFDKSADRNGFHKLLISRNLGVLVSNLLIIFVFVDWRERLLHGCSCGFFSKSPVSSSIQIGMTNDGADELPLQFSKRWEEALFMDDVETRMRRSIIADKAFSQTYVTEYESEFI